MISEVLINECQEKSTAQNEIDLLKGRFFDGRAAAFSELFVSEGRANDAAGKWRPNQACFDVIGRSD